MNKKNDKWVFNDFEWWELLPLPIGIAVVVSSIYITLFLSFGGF